MRRLSLALLCLYTIFLLSGCRSYDYTEGNKPYLGRYPTVAIIGYSGDIKEFDEVGVITTDGTITVKTIDGILVNTLRKYEIKTRIPSQTGRYQVHLMPGIYILELELFSEALPFLGQPALRSRKPITRIIGIKKGEVLHLSLIQPESGTWSIKFHNGIAALPEIKKDFQKMKNENEQ
jgi:hypothetical protein